MTTLDPQSSSAVTALLEKDEAWLYRELGSRLRRIERDPSLGGSYSVPKDEFESLGPLEDLTALGKSFFNRINVEGYALVCGSDPAKADDRKEVVAAFELGRDAVVVSLATLLVSSLGLAPPLAGVAAALLVKICFRSALGATCDVWKTKLPAPAGEPQGPATPPGPPEA